MSFFCLVFDNSLSLVSTAHMCKSLSPPLESGQPPSCHILSASGCISKNKTIFFNNFNVVIKIGKLCNYFSVMSIRVCLGNWYHHDFYCAYNLVWFQRDHHISPAFCSCFTNFLQMMSKWSSLLLDSGSITPFIPCGYKAIHQKLFWDLPEIIHLSQFLILFFMVGKSQIKKKTFELQRYLMCGL